MQIKMNRYSIFSKPIISPTIRLSYYACSLACFFAKKIHEVFSQDTVCKQVGSSRALESIEQPPQPPEPLASSAINVSFHHGILRAVVGPAARHSCSFHGEIRVYSCAFVVDNK